ncbi:MAG: hypothetical protein SGI96_17420 [Bacteroidota bacterium]|nr:hypothetical protein [Bacteroidota bacterium]
MFLMNKKPNEIMSDAEKFFGLDENTIHLIKISYSIDEEINLKPYKYSDEAKQFLIKEVETRSPGWLLDEESYIKINIEKIHSPFTILFTENEIGKFIITKSFLKKKTSHSQREAVFGHEKFSFKVIKLLEPFLSVLLSLMFIYSSIKLMMLLTPNGNLPVYDYIIITFFFLLSYWRIYFHSKEKNLRNRLVLLKLQFEISCKDWIRELYQHLLNPSYSKIQLRNRIKRESLSFFYSAQFSSRDITRIVNTDLRYICESIELDFLELISVTLVNLDSLKEEQERVSQEKLNDFQRRMSE